MDALEGIIRGGTTNTLTQNDKALLVAALQQLINITTDELASRGASSDQKASSQHRTQLQAQIEEWQQLLQKLGENPHA